MAATSAPRRRSIRSFVKRSGRLTPGQQRALDQLWPKYGIPSGEAVLDLPALFPGKSGFVLEIGFGNGESLIEMAAAEPQLGFIGIEVHEPGVGHCLKGLHERGLDNLRLMADDAIDILESRMPPASLDRVQLYFPDPWHKKRHHKRRIVNARFRDLVARALKPGGLLHLATDWQDYAEHMAAELLPDERFENRGDARGYAPRPEWRPQTKFERRGLRLGHGVWDLLFRRRQFSLPSPR